MNLRQARKIIKKYVSRGRWSPDMQKLAASCGFLFCSADLMGRAERRYNKGQGWDYAMQYRKLLPTRFVPDPKWLADRM